MLNKVSYFGRLSITYIETLGRASIFLSRTLSRMPNILQAIRLIIEQMCFVGVLSLIIMVISALFIGMVLGLQGYNTLNKFGATQQLGQLIALSVVRELGPVVTALLFAGRAGSALTAEIGLMKATDQLSSMEMMGVDPLKRIITPRLWAGILAVPILTAIFNAMAIFGGYLVGVIWLGVDDGSFWSNMQSSVNFYTDVLSGLIKSVVFGFVVTWIAVFEGYDCMPTSAGISQATTRSVVNSSLAVLGLDFVLTTMMLGGW